MRGLASYPPGSIVFVFISAPCGILADRYWSRLTFFGPMEEWPLYFAAVIAAAVIFAVAADVAVAVVVIYGFCAAPSRSSFICNVMF
jgi:hypothetical protein